MIVGSSHVTCEWREVLITAFVDRPHRMRSLITGFKSGTGAASRIIGDDGLIFALGRSLFGVNRSSGKLYKSC